jgi:hypothetical protein
MTYSDLNDILTEVSTLLEDDHTLPSGRIVRIRELSAAARIEASQAAQADGAFNAVLFNAIVVQAGTIRPPIPKTDIPKLMAGRGGVISGWANAIWGLSEATPAAFKSGDRAVDATEQDQGNSAPDS